MKADLIKIKRALISVSDKSGLDELARVLNYYGIEILSTGGTASHLAGCGIPIRTVEDFTGHPEILDGRVKTLHPRVHAALLARRDDRKHLDQCKKLNIEFIDMVVVNLYPFEQTVARKVVTLDEAVEQIDIGGPTILRSAAKNFDSVAVVTSPDQYPAVIEQLKASQGGLDRKMRFALAQAVFERTSNYDRYIADFLKKTSPDRQE